MEFTFGGRKIRLTRKKIETRLAGIEPEPIRQLCVKVGGRLYPVKQAIVEAASLSKGDLNSHEARKALIKLGFEVIDRKPS